MYLLQIVEAPVVTSSGHVTKKNITRNWEGNYRDRYPPSDRTSNSAVAECSARLTAVRNNWGRKCATYWDTQLENYRNSRTYSSTRSSRWCYLTNMTWYEQARLRIGCPYCHFSSGWLDLGFRQRRMELYVPTRDRGIYQTLLRSYQSDVHWYESIRSRHSAQLSCQRNPDGWLVEPSQFSENSIHWLHRLVKRLDVFLLPTIQNRRNREYTGWIWNIRHG